MLEWFVATLRSYPEIAIFLARGIGYYVGQFSFRGIGLGAVTRDFGPAERCHRAWPGTSWRRGLSPRPMPPGQVVSSSTVLSRQQASAGWLRVET